MVQHSNKNGLPSNPLLPKLQPGTHGHLLEQAAGINIIIDEWRGLECCPAPPVRKMGEEVISGLDNKDTSLTWRNGFHIYGGHQFNSLHSLHRRSGASSPKVFWRGRCLPAMLGDMGNADTSWQQLLSTGNRTGELGLGMLSGSGVLQILGKGNRWSSSEGGPGSS